jgi:hypothetical protein
VLLGKLQIENAALNFPPCSDSHLLGEYAKVHQALGEVLQAAPLSAHEPMIRHVLAQVRPNDASALTTDHIWTDASSFLLRFVFLARFLSIRMSFPFPTLSTRLRNAPDLRLLADLHTTSACELT